MLGGVLQRMISWAAVSAGEVRRYLGFEKFQPKTHSKREGSERRAGRRLKPLAKTMVELSSGSTRAA